MKFASLWALLNRLAVSRVHGPHQDSCGVSGVIAIKHFAGAPGVHRKIELSVADHTGAPEKRGDASLKKVRATVGVR